jgi:hypothetical protein
VPPARAGRSFWQEVFLRRTQVRALKNGHEPGAPIWVALQLLGGQALQDLFAQFLGFSERFLIFDEDAVQFERMIGGKLVAQHHVANVNGVGEGRVFGEFF